MSLKKNILAGYVGQGCVSLIGIVILPLYIKYMGEETYGLVGFFAMLQILFTLLDMGLSHTVSRESARFQGGALGAHGYRQLLRDLQWLFLALAVLGSSGLWIGAEWLAKHWLKVQKLPIEEVVYAIRIMAIIVGLRWMAGLYRGVLTGFERLIWLNAYNVAGASARFLGVLPILLFIGNTPIIFFTYQLGIAILEFLCLYLMTRRLLPVCEMSTLLWFSFSPVRAVLKFSLTVALTSFIWTIVTQMDKLLLSKLLTLTDYGYFSLAVMAASGINIISSPVGNTVMPRLARLEAEGSQQELIRIYRHSTQLMVNTVWAVAITLCIYAEPIIALWSGNVSLARYVTPIFLPYVLGNAVLAVRGFPNCLQYAKGDLKLHVIGSLLFLVLLIPAMIYTTPRYGGMGAGWVWMLVNSVFFFCWIPLVHGKVQPGIHIPWMVKDVFPIIASQLALAFMVYTFIPVNQNPPLILIQIIVTGVLLLVSGTLSSGIFWYWLRRRYMRIT